MLAEYNKIPVGISSCLLGEAVRYDGDHSHEPRMIERLRDRLELISICPEMAIGMGVPRAPIQLVKTAEGIRVQGVNHKNTDVTEALTAFAAQVLQDTPAIYGYIFKSRSPSCGIGDTKIFDESDRLIGRNATGIFAGGIITIRSNLPVTNETSLQAVADIERFIEQVERYREAINHA